MNEPILTQVTGPSSYPVTLAEAKDHCRVDFPDDDSYITRLIAAATAQLDYANGILGRALITQDWKVEVALPDYTINPRGAIRLPVTPVQSIQSMGYYDSSNASQSLTVGDFQLINRNWTCYVIPNATTNWPGLYNREDALSVTFRAGFGDDSTAVPENIKSALLFLLAHMYENREAVIVGSESQALPEGFDALVSNIRGCLI